jgi:hypothetical protein
MSDTPKTHLITSDTGPSHLEWQATVASDIVTLSDQLMTATVMSNFAEDWFADAHGEVIKDTSNPAAATAARRREIIFAVCALESYLLEWTRDILLSRYSQAELLDRLDKYFPMGRKNPITTKWNTVPKALCEDNLIKDRPDLIGKAWQTFKKDVYEYYRNSLIHASASRPQQKVTASLAPPTDWKAELGTLPAGWAIDIVAELIRDLNNKAGTRAPAWLDDGDKK